MKILFFSDVHGVSSALKKLLEHVSFLVPDRMILLGDVLYHGPRNGVPAAYDPKETADLLNGIRTQLLAVRGNCDTEVDQMMLNFPVLSDFSELLLPDARFFLTHGHHWNAEHLPPVPSGTILAHGHTHIPENRILPEGIRLFNPGSVSLPKNGFPASFGYYDGKKLTVRRLDDGTVLM